MTYSSRRSLFFLAAAVSAEIFCSPVRAAEAGGTEKAETEAETEMETENGEAPFDTDKYGRLIQTVYDIYTSNGEYVSIGSDCDLSVKQQFALWHVLAEYFSGESKDGRTAEVPTEEALAVAQAVYPDCLKLPQPEPSDRGVSVNSSECVLDVEYLDPPDPVEIEPSDISVDGDQYLVKVYDGYVTITMEENPNEKKDTEYDFPYRLVNFKLGF